MITEKEREIIEKCIEAAVIDNRSSKDYIHFVFDYQMFFLTFSFYSTKKYRKASSVKRDFINLIKRLCKMLDADYEIKDNELHIYNYVEIMTEEEINTQQ